MADLERLVPEERSAVDNALISWVDSGPPRDRSRVVAGLTLFEHHLASGIAITCFVDEDQLLVGLLRVRRL